MLSKLRDINMATILENNNFKSHKKCDNETGEVTNFKRASRIATSNKKKS